MLGDRAGAGANERRAWIFDPDRAGMSRGTFRSLRIYNYRLWAAGAIVSNIGTWMQRTAQDWLVLAELTDHKASAVGIVMALQFGPQLALLPATGYVADHYDRRKILIATQTLSGLLALGLGLLTVFGAVALWQVDLFALALGCVSAFDAPARQTFVSELVDEAHISNAVALNSTSFNAGRSIGPAVAGVLIAMIGTGWVFLLNAVSFIGVVAALMALRIHDLHRSARPPRRPGALVEGFHYVWGRPDLRAILMMLGVVGMFGLNFPIFISKMAVSVFHTQADGYGLLSSAMAVGSVIGALMSARRERPDFQHLLVGSALFAAGCIIAAAMPNPWLFAVPMFLVGLASQTLTTSITSMVQLTTDPSMRGRVSSIMVAIALGTTPVGAPIMGWIADHLGARLALALGGSSGIAALLIGLRYSRTTRQREAIAAQP
jgi:MFS family permease